MSSELRARLQRALIWSLRSPRNWRRTRNVVVGFFAAVTLVGVVAASAGLGKVLVARQAAASVQPAQQLASPVGVTRLLEPAHDEQPVDPAPVRRQAAGFVSTWLAATSMPRSAWLARVKAYATPAVHPYLALTDPIAVPRTKLLSVSVDAASEAEATATARLADGSSIRVTLQYDGRTWLVSGYEEA